MRRRFLTFPIVFFITGSCLADNSIKELGNLTCGNTLEKLNQIRFVSNRELFRATCPPGCEYYSRPVYGAGPYEAMSSVCRAAIHNGSIPATGGSFLIETLYGFHQAFVRGSFRNNIQTKGARTEYRGFFTLRIKSSSDPETDVVSIQLTTTTVAKSSEITKTVDCDKIVASVVSLTGTKPSISVPMQTTFPSIPESVSQVGSPTKSTAPMNASSLDTLQKEYVKHKTLSVIYTSTSSSTYLKSQLNNQKVVILEGNLTCGTTLQKLNQISFQSDKELFRASCPSGCARYSRSVYGAGPYEEMSSVCRAAIHNGSILASGGSFLIETLYGYNKAFERMSFKNDIQTKRARTEYRGFITIKIEKFSLDIQESNVKLHSSLLQNTSTSDAVLESSDIFLGTPAEIVLVVSMFAVGILLASSVFFIYKHRVKGRHLRTCLFTIFFTVRRKTRRRSQITITNL